MSTFLFLTHIAVASVVTCHILLRKSNVRAAIGWIAVVWLTLVIGILLYLLFGINRVSRRAARLSRVPKSPHGRPVVSVAPATPVHIRKLAAIGQQITGMSLTAGNRITVHHGGQKAYGAMIDAINGARHSIAMASYIFRYDEVGHRFVEALIAARDRGVAVRVLVDGIGGGYLRDPTFRALRNAGVSCERFLHSWMPWRMPMLNLRNHKKLLIIDGVTSFTGGLNIGDENCGPTTKHGRVDDVHVGICGPVSRQLLISFAQDWTFTTDENLEGERWWPDLSLHQTGFGASLARGIPSGPDADVYHIETVLGAALVLAQHRVRIVTPYFLPDDQLQFAIEQACLRGVIVEIVIPEHSDHLFMDWAMRAQVRAFKEIATTISLGAAPFSHAKLLTVDGIWSLVGSTNWDTRSLRLNFEFDLECYDSVVCGELDALIDAKIACSRTLTDHELEVVPVWQRICHAAARLLLPYL